MRKALYDKRRGKQYKNKHIDTKWVYKDETLSKINKNDESKSYE